MHNPQLQLRLRVEALERAAYAAASSPSRYARSRAEALRETAQALYPLLDPKFDYQAAKKRRALSPVQRELDQLRREAVKRQARAATMRHGGRRALARAAALERSKRQAHAARLRVIRQMPSDVLMERAGRNRGWAGIFVPGAWGWPAT
jgi:hypothetical protein